MYTKISIDSYCFRFLVLHKKALYEAEFEFIWALLAELKSIKAHYFRFEPDRSRLIYSDYLIIGTATFIGLTNCTERSPFWEANCSPANHNFPRRIEREISLPFSPETATYSCPPCSLKIHFNFILPCKPRSSKWSLPLVHSSQHFDHIFFSLLLPI